MTRRWPLDLVVSLYIIDVVGLVFALATADYSGTLHTQRGVSPIHLLMTSYLALTVFLLIVMFVDLGRSDLRRRPLIALALFAASPISIPLYYFRFARKSERIWPHPDLRSSLLLGYSLFAIFFFVLTIGAAMMHAQLGEFRWYRILFRINSYLFVASCLWYVFDAWRQRISIGAKVAWGIGVVVAGVVFLPTYVLLHSDRSAASRSASIQ